MKYVGHAIIAGAGALALVAAATPSLTQQPAQYVAGIPDAELQASEGFHVALLSAIAARVGFQLTFVSAQPGLEGLASGAFDILANTPPAASALARRHAYGVLFTGLVTTSSEALIVLATDPTRYTALADLRGQPVGSTDFETFNDVLASAGATLRIYENETAMQAALVAGEIRAYVSGGGATDLLLAQRRGQQLEFRIVETYEPFFITHRAIAVRASDTELLGQLHVALEQLKADGTLATLATQYGRNLPPDMVANWIP